jgi:hypothetical protein
MKQQVRILQIDDVAQHVTNFNTVSTYSILRTPTVAGILKSLRFPCVCVCNLSTVKN